MMKKILIVCICLLGAACTTPAATVRDDGGDILNTITKMEPTCGTYFMVAIEMDMIKKYNADGNIHESNIHKCIGTALATYTGEDMRSMVARARHDTYRSVYEEMYTTCAKEVQGDDVEWLDRGVQNAQEFLTANQSKCTGK